MPSLAVATTLCAACFLLFLSINGVRAQCATVARLNGGAPVQIDLSRYRGTGISSATELLGTGELCSQSFAVALNSDTLTEFGDLLLLPGVLSDIRFSRGRILETDANLADELWAADAGIGAFWPAASGAPVRMLVQQAPANTFDGLEGDILARWASSSLGGEQGVQFSLEVSFFDVGCSAVQLRVDAGVQRNFAVSDRSDIEWDASTSVVLSTPGPDQLPTAGPSLSNTAARAEFRRARINVTLPVLPLNPPLFAATDAVVMRVRFDSLLGSCLDLTTRDLVALSSFTAVVPPDFNLTEPMMSRSPTPSHTETPTVSETPTETPSESPSSSVSPSISPTPSVTPSHSPSPSATPSDGYTPSMTSSARPTASNTASPTADPTPSATRTATYSPTRGFLGENFTTSSSAAPSIEPERIAVAESSSSDGLSVGAIVGIALGGSVAVCCICCLVLLASALFVFFIAGVVSRRKNGSDRSRVDSDASPEDLFMSGGRHTQLAAADLDGMTSVAESGALSDATGTHSSALM